MFESPTDPAAKAVRITAGASAQRILLHCCPSDRLEVQSRLGVSLSDQMLRASASGDWTSLHLAPDEWLLIGASSAGSLPVVETHSPPLSLVEVSDRFLALEVEGAAAQALLAVGCPVDLHLDAFPVQSCTRAPLGKADVTLWRREGESFTLLVARSFYPYVIAFLTRAAADLSVD